MSEINLLKYEVSPCEPLHVTKEHIKNVLEELPHHVNAKDKPTMNATIKALQQDKEQLRGVDFRKQLLIVTAAMSANNADTKVPSSLTTWAIVAVDGERNPVPLPLKQIDNWNAARPGDVVSFTHSNAKKTGRLVIATGVHVVEGAHSRDNLKVVNKLYQDKAYIHAAMKQYYECTTPDAI
ncbi:AP-5 complex subunit zeta-1 [Branchiostoma belcheri]|nr:AP-5 complex subunit zeta-1 [Branchiostoma belcheri]